MSGSNSFIEAKLKLEAYCAYQDRCHYEVETKLRQFDLSEERRADIILHLLENKFLDEQRFAESFVSGKLKIKHWGRMKIKQGLKSKFVSSQLIEKALKTIDLDLYDEILQKIALRKWNELKSEKNIFTKKGKVFRFLASRGFESDLIYGILNDLEKK